MQRTDYQHDGISHHFFVVCCLHCSTVFWLLWCCYFPFLDEHKISTLPFLFFLLFERHLVTQSFKKKKKHKLFRLCSFNIKYIKFILKLFSSCRLCSFNIKYIKFILKLFSSHTRVWNVASHSDLGWCNCWKKKWSVMK